MALLVCDTTRFYEIVQNEGLVKPPQPLKYGLFIDFFDEICYTYIR